MSTETLNQYQRTELAKLTRQGWTVAGIRRLQDDLNPWASVDMRDPNGNQVLTALPASVADAKWLSGS